MSTSFIYDISSRLQSVNSILRSCDNGALSFDDAMTLAAFYRDYSDTNSLIESAENEVTEDADRLLKNTVSLVSEIEKFSAVGVAGIQSVDFEQLFEDYLKPFEVCYESAKTISTTLWRATCKIFAAMASRPPKEH